jgi:hypothetical protein
MSSGAAVDGALSGLDVDLLIGLVREGDPYEGLSAPAMASAARRAGRPIDASLRDIDERLRRMHHLGVIRRYRKRGGNNNTRRYHLTALGAEILAGLI